MTTQLTQPTKPFGLQRGNDLVTDFENAKILDFRDKQSPNNKIVILCDYASNALPEGYTWSDHDREHFANEHWAWDVASLETAVHLAKNIKCLLVHSLYSRLLIDIDKDVPSHDLFIRRGNGQDVDLNKDLTQVEESLRIVKYHVPYYSALREISEKVDPDMVITIHSFPENEEGAGKDLEIGVEFLDSTEFGQRMYEEIQEKGYQVEKNKPYASSRMNTLNTILRSSYPVRRQGVCLEIRNDILQDEIKGAKLNGDLFDIINKFCIDETNLIADC